MAYVYEKGFPSYMPDELDCLKDAPNVEWLDGNGVIDGYIKYEITGAHSKFHQVYWIVDGGETVFFGGDDAPQLQQMRSRFVAKYDFDGKKAMELRQQWWQKKASRKNGSSCFITMWRTPPGTSSKKRPALERTGHC